MAPNDAVEITPTRKAHTDDHPDGNVSPDASAEDVRPANSCHPAAINSQWLFAINATYPDT